MLGAKIIKYLNHKLLLAKVSPWYQSPDKKQAVDWAYLQQQWLKYQGKHLTDQEIARVILPNTKHLETLLPAPSNKSYESSLNNLEAIKQLCKHYLSPTKTV